MNPIKRRIYFDSKGFVFFELNLYSETSVEKDIEDFKVLSERNRDSFDVLELEYGRYAQDFAECNGYRVNPETKELEFSYLDPNEPEAPLFYEKPLSEQIADLKAENLATMGAVAEVYEMLLGGM